MRQFPSWDGCSASASPRVTFDDSDLEISLSKCHSYPHLSLLLCPHLFFLQISTQPSLRLIGQCEVMDVEDPELCSAARHLDMSLMKSGAQFLALVESARGRDFTTLAEVVLA